MALYTIYAPAKPEGAATGPADLVFIKDGFCWPALFIPLVWMLYRRLWLVLLIYVVAVFCLGTLAAVAGEMASTLVLILFAFYFALEANGLRRWTIERRRHALIGVVEGRNLGEAERRFFMEWPAKADLDGAATPRAPPAPPTPAASPMPPSLLPRPGEPEIVGLFPAPGRGR
jgi:hypothetical protein